MPQLREDLFMFLSILSDKQIKEIYPVIRQELQKVFYGTEIPIIETNLTEEEIKLAEEGIKDYREHPETFTDLEDLIKEEI